MNDDVKAKKPTPKIKKKKFPCNASGCKGELDITNLKVIDGFTRIAYCKKCGKGVKLVNTKPCSLIKDGTAERDKPKEHRTKKERRKANAEARKNLNRIANTGVKYVP